MQEEIRDLLSKDQKKRLELKERPDTGVYVKVCTSFPYSVLSLFLSKQLLHFSIISPNTSPPFNFVLMICVSQSGSMVSFVFTGHIIII